jgi:hypothetical protein
MRNAHNNLVGNSKERGHLEDTGVEGTMSDSILNK